jgi:hypothetical protein
LILRCRKGYRARPKKLAQIPSETGYDLPRGGFSDLSRRFRLRANLHVSTATVEVSLVETGLLSG